MSIGSSPEIGTRFTNQYNPTNVYGYDLMDGYATLVEKERGTQTVRQGVACHPKDMWLSDDHHLVMVASLPEARVRLALV